MQKSAAARAEHFRDGEEAFVEKSLLMTSFHERECLFNYEYKLIGWNLKEWLTNFVITNIVIVC